MDSSVSLDIEKGLIPEPREDIIKTAVKFLQNPQVAKSPLAQSQKFLKSKGLSDQEIQIACERSGAYNNHYFNEKPPCPPPHSLQLQSYQPQSIFYKVRDTLQSVAVFTGLGYLIYLFYKRFIRPWLFGDERRRRSVEDKISDLNKNVTESINDLRENLMKVKVQVDRLGSDSEGHSMQSQLSELKNEISSVKGLLLNRKQFPSVPPSIPAWQLSSVPTTEQEQDAEGKHEDMLEIGSGSGSSETEVVTKNSDSSLEIM